MGRPERESRPGDESRAAASTSILATIVPPTGDVLADLDALAEELDGYLVVRVTVDDAGHRRTNLYRSAAAAQRAVERARDRGRTTHVTLCRLLPVGVVTASLGGGR